VLAVPAGLETNVEFRSVSGKASVPPRAVAGPKGRSWKLGDGGPATKVKTVSGSFTLRQLE
jgi:hypothetical protein